jgi:nuclear GTP-binding protein
MGTGKKEAARKVRQGKVGDGMANVKTKVYTSYAACQPKLTFSPGREFLP